MAHNLNLVVVDTCKHLKVKINFALLSLSLFKNLKLCWILESYFMHLKLLMCIFLSFKKLNEIQDQLGIKKNAMV